VVTIAWSTARGFMLEDDEILRSAADNRHDFAVKGLDAARDRMNSGADAPPMQPSAGVDLGGPTSGPAMSDRIALVHRVELSGGLPTPGR
jgi:hypothetical protein